MRPLISPSHEFENPLLFGAEHAPASFETHRSDMPRSTDHRHPKPGPEQAKPDIVVFLADDLSARDLSIYGGTNIPTPAIHQLASEGLTFNRAFVASPSCAPSRAALLTGLMPARNGAKRITVTPERIFSDCHRF